MGDKKVFDAFYRFFYQDSNEVWNCGERPGRIFLVSSPGCKSETSLSIRAILKITNCFSYSRFPILFLNLISSL